MSLPQGCLWPWVGGHIPLSLPAAGHCRLSNLARQSERLGLWRPSLSKEQRRLSQLPTTENTGQTSRTAGISKYLTHCWNADPNGWKLLLPSPLTSLQRPRVAWDGLCLLLVHGGQRPPFPQGKDAGPAYRQPWAGQLLAAWLAVNAGARRASYWPVEAASVLFICITRKISANGQGLTMSVCVHLCV